MSSTDSFHSSLNSLMEHEFKNEDTQTPKGSSQVSSHLISLSLQHSSQLLGPSFLSFRQELRQFDQQIALKRKMKNSTKFINNNRGGNQIDTRESFRPFVLQVRGMAQTNIY